MIPLNDDDNIIIKKEWFFYALFNLIKYSNDLYVLISNFFLYFSYIVYWFFHICRHVQFFRPLLDPQDPHKDKGLDISNATGIGNIMINNNHLLIFNDNREYKKNNY